MMNVLTLLFILVIDNAWRGDDDDVDDVGK